MSEPGTMNLFCSECNKHTLHRLSKIYPRLYYCRNCKTLRPVDDATHTHTHDVSISPSTDGSEDDDRVLRQKPEEKREGERE